MTNILASSQIDLNRVKGLLDKGRPPVYRKAYSDRTAWLMACLSELAYIRFNPIFSHDQHKKHLLDNLSKLIDENKQSSLIKLIASVGYDHNEEKEKLKNELTTLKIRLLETFDKNGTQAILAENDEFIVLSFRGTEATCMKDIKADANAEAMQCETGGKIHTGFKNAFDEVALDIQNTLNKEALKAKPLFITGHSLGGALATVAAKKLSHKGGIAACYTFGSPRVGDEEWIADIKTPIYRLVNAADCVTMLPLGTELMTILSWICQFIPSVGEAISSKVLKLSGYIHGGNMRYLTNCSSGQYDGVRLLYSVGFLYRIKGWVIKKLPWKKFLADHSISIYRKKLMIVAENRNQNDNTN